MTGAAEGPAIRVSVLSMSSCCRRKLSGYIVGPPSAHNCPVCNDSSKGVPFSMTNIFELSPAPINRLTRPRNLITSQKGSGEMAASRFQKFYGGKRVYTYVSYLSGGPKRVHTY